MSPAPVAASDSADGNPPWLLLAGVWLIYCAFGLVATSLAPLVSVMVRELEISHSAMGSVMGAWQLIYIAAAVPCGLLLDRLDSRWALLLGAALIAASALGRSFAEGYWSLLLAVMLFGLGGPIVSAGAPKVITSHFTGSRRGLAMGIYMTGPALGGVVSLTLTHAVLLPLFDGSWRAVFALWAGFTALAALVWFLIASRQLRLGRARAAAAAHASGPNEPALGIRELLRLPAVRLVMLMSVAVFMLNHGLNNWLPELLHSGGMPLTSAGYWAALPTLVGIAGSLLIPRLATPNRRFAILAGLALAALAACLLLLSSAQPNLTIGLLLQGIARSSLMTVLILTLVELPSIGDRNAGTASGLFFSAAEVGGVLGPLSLGVIYDVSGSFSVGLYLLAAVAMLLLLGVSRLRALARSPQTL